ncbi:MAG: hypothetical protein LC107_12520 [Chitinophagales bacterium]|nr:hypothetical protein [Chitinophagales bacterium]
MKRKFLMVAVVLLVLVLVGTDMVAQCPMCKLSAETNLQGGGTAGRGLNKGILYLLSMPYLIFGFLGYTWFKNRKRLEYNDEVSTEMEN